MIDGNYNYRFNSIKCIIIDCHTRCARNDLLYAEKYTKSKL